MRGLRLKPAGVMLATVIAFGATLSALPAVAGNNPPPRPSPARGEGVSSGRMGSHHPIRHQPALSQALGGTRQAKAAAPAAPPVGVAWTSLGPRPITGLSTYGNSAGRVTALAAKPGGSVVYAGTADGGVWRSTDGGASWSTTTDGQATMAIGAIAVDWSTTPETVYAATGEANLCQDCMPSQGVLKSIDGGATFSSANAGLTNLRMSRSGPVAIDPTNTSRSDIGPPPLPC